MAEKTLWIKDEHLRAILDQRKTVEVRVAYGNIAKLNEGDILLLNEEHPFIIRRIGRYADFDELLKHEDPQAIAPHLPPKDLPAELRAIYPPEKEALGVIALELAPVEHI